MALVAAVGSVTATLVMLLDGLSGGSDLRSGLVPVGFGVLAGSGGLALLAARGAGVGSQSRWTSPVAGVTGLALLAVAAFFFSLAVLSLLGSDLLDSETALTAAGTLLAGLLTFVVVPGGLLLFGFLVFRDHTMPLALRLDPWILLAFVILGPVVVAALPERQELAPHVLWVALLTAVIVHFVTGVRRRATSGGRRAGR